jgi:hypothetical protein
MHAQLFGSMPQETAIVPVDKTGTISSSETWSGVIHITGDVTVTSGNTLTIDPNTKVIFQGNYYMEVLGSLSAIGTSTQRIEFKPNEAVTPNFYGVICGGIGQVQPPSSSSYVVKYCDFTKGSKNSLRGSSGDYTYARGGGLCCWIPESLEIDSCNFYNCESHTSGGGLYINGSSLGRNYTVKNCYFENCVAHNSFAGAFKFDHGGTYTLSNLTFNNCSNNFSTYKNLPVPADSSTDILNFGEQHYMADGVTIYYTSGTPPSPLQLETAYYSVSSSAGNSTLKLATSVANAVADITIDLTDNGTSAQLEIYRDWLIFDAAINWV